MGLKYCDKCEVAVDQAVLECPDCGHKKFVPGTVIWKRDTPKPSAPKVTTPSTPRLAADLSSTNQPNLMDSAPPGPPRPTPNVNGEFSKTGKTIDDLIRAQNRTTHAVRAFVPRMLEDDAPGHIVNTASMGGLVTGAYSGPYFTSKFAAVGLTDCLAQDLRTTGKNVAASVLVPSLINTDIGTSGRNRQERWIDRGREATPDAEFVEAMLADSTAGGMSPTEVADLVFDAVEAGDFWIPTQPSFHDQIRARHEDMQALRLAVPPTLD